MSKLNDVLTDPFREHEALYMCVCVYSWWEYETDLSSAKANKCVNRFISLYLRNSDTVEHFSSLCDSLDLVYKYFLKVFQRNKNVLPFNVKFRNTISFTLML